MFILLYKPDIAFVFTFDVVLNRQEFLIVLLQSGKLKTLRKDVDTFFDY